MIQALSDLALQRASALALLAALAGGAIGCSSGSDEAPATGPATGPEPEPEPAADFSIRSATRAPVLIEGDSDGLVLPITLERDAGHDTPVSLRLEGEDESAIAFVTHAFDTDTIATDDSEAQLTLRLDIADRSIMPGARRFFVVASDGERTVRTRLDVTIEPVDAPDVYLLIGQSNMVGSSGGGTRRSGPGEPDEPNERVKQLNVTGNDPFVLFAEPAAYSSREANVTAGPPIVVAQDPLHEPLNTERESDKGADYIGLGLTFGKRALADTTRDVVLVPAAWGGSAFCDNENDPMGHWNPDDSDNPALGNTLLFDRAVLRANIALEESGGILRGILWHQGESDANLPCAMVYGENLQRLAGALRTRIQPDRRGAALRTADAPIPFIAGTMSRGVVNSDNDYSFDTYNEAKRIIDEVHREVRSVVTHSDVSIHDDLVPDEGFACGSGDCIHFGPDALREMGSRYHAALGRAFDELSDESRASPP